MLRVQHIVLPWARGARSLLSYSLLWDWVDLKQVEEFWSDITQWWLIASYALCWMPADLYWLNLIFCCSGLVLLSGLGRFSFRYDPQCVVLDLISAMMGFRSLAKVFRMIMPDLLFLIKRYYFFPVLMIAKTFPLESSLFLSWSVWYVVF